MVDLGHGTRRIPAIARAPMASANAAVTVAPQKPTATVRTNKEQRPMSDNLDIVREVYRRFGAGDIPGILELWDKPTDCQACMGLTVDDIPMAGKRSGKPALVELLACYAEVFDFDLYEPREFIAGGDTVVVLGAYQGTVKATGKPFASEWVHIFRLSGGKAVAWQEFCDTAALKAAATH